ncbi:MAG TPA: tRNA threonylcarbamoyladenosine dehydratase [Rudaea sp.]|nr:tRNA threonylcarbamoyladenosine dehydratase [Rudaea sp.]
MDQRFAGIERLYGIGTVARLAQRHVCVVGIGGVGSWAAEALARSGVGELTLIDADDVCVSNVNRQSHALDGEFGRPKVDVLGERLRAINPEIRLHALPEFVTTTNLDMLLDRGYDAVIDACDALRVKIEMIAFCKRRKIPIVVSGSAGGRTDPTLIASRDLSRTDHDALLALVRRKLRDEHGWSRSPKRYFGVQAVFSRENVQYPQADGSVCGTRPQSTGGALKLDCGGGLGAAMHVTATVGMVAAARVIERLLKTPRQA